MLGSAPSRRQEVDQATTEREGNRGWDVPEQRSLRRPPVKDCASSLHPKEGRDDTRDQDDKTNETDGSRGARGRCGEYEYSTEYDTDRGRDEQANGACEFSADREERVG